MRPRIGVPGWPVGSRAQSPSSRIPPHFLSLLASSFPSSGTHLHDVDILTIGNLENADHPHGFFKNSAGYCHLERIIYIYSRTLRPGFFPFGSHKPPLAPSALCPPTLVVASSWLLFCPHPSGTALSSPSPSNSLPRCSLLFRSSWSFLF